MIMLVGLACSSETPDSAPRDMKATVVQNPYADYLTHQGIYVTFSEGIGEPALLALLQETDLQPIRSISLHGQPLTAASVQGIMASNHTTELHSLFMQNSRIGDAGLTALAASPRLAQLEHINLSGVGATAAGIAALAASPYLKPKSLTLGWEMIGDTGAIALAQARGVKSLHLESAGIGPAGMVALLEKTSAQSLYLGKNPGGLAHLTHVSPSLEGVYLEACALSSDDIHRLSRVRAPGLKTLSLGLTPLTDDDLRAILKAPWFLQLQQFELGAHGTSPALRRAFIQAFQGEFLSMYRKDL